MLKTLIPINWKITKLYTKNKTKITELINGTINVLSNKYNNAFIAHYVIK